MQCEHFLNNKALRNAHISILQWRNLCSRSKTSFAKAGKITWLSSVGLKMADCYGGKCIYVILQSSSMSLGMCTTSLTYSMTNLVPGIKASLTVAHPVESERPFYVFWPVGALEYWPCMPCADLSEDGCLSTNAIYQQLELTETCS